MNFQKCTFVLILAASSCLFAQDGPNAVFFQASGPDQGPGPVTGAAVALGRPPAAPVQGAPYAATMTNESIQTLADGNRIVQTSSGATARDSQGRTRQDAPIPPIGNLSPTNAPHLVFIQDPVAQAAYTLDLTNKIAQKMPALPPGPGGPAGPAGTFFLQTGPGPAPSNPPASMPSPPPPVPPPPPPVPPVLLQREGPNDPAQVTIEDLGSQTIEGVLANGMRTTRTIPAGQIGNDKPIAIVTEVWTSPDLKTIVYSKRSDPRMGEQTFRLSNIVRGEPDSSLFTIPPDFKVVDGPQPIVYRRNQ